MRDKDMNSTPINGKNDYSVDVDDENHFQNPSMLNPPLNCLPNTFNYTFPRGTIDFLINLLYFYSFLEDYQFNGKSDFVFSNSISNFSFFFFDNVGHVVGQVVSIQFTNNSLCCWLNAGKDLSRVKTGFKSVPLQFYFEIAGLASSKNQREIQNITGEVCF